MAKTCCSHPQVGLSVQDASQYDIVTASLPVISLRGFLVRRDCSAKRYYGDVSQSCFDAARWPEGHPSSVSRPGQKRLRFHNRYPARSGVADLLLLRSSCTRTCMRQLARYCIGGTPMICAERSVSADRDSPTARPSSSTLQGSPGRLCSAARARDTKGSLRPASQPVCPSGNDSA